MTCNYQVAIDGPAGAGKSTAAKLAAQRLDFLYIDTGAIYRAVTWAAIEKKLDLHDEKAVSELAENINIDIVTDRDSIYRIYVDDSEVTGKIRLPEISQNVSLVAKIPKVREHLLCKQRKLVVGGYVVMEGRDIGTAVLPRADFKFFLTAAPEERARRRYEELAAQGYEVSYEDLVEEIKERDRIDSSREVAPLKPAPDAVEIDCTQLSAEQVVDIIVSKVTGG